jgi:hypothetical protein
MKTPILTECALLLGAVLVVGGCQPVSERNASQSAAPPGKSGELNVLTEHRTTPTTHAPDKAIGEDCGLHGAPECISHLCLHVGGRDKGYVCSQSCGDNANCPARWQCRSMSLSVRQAVCLPPLPEKKS